MVKRELFIQKALIKELTPANAAKGWVKMFNFDRWLKESLNHLGVAFYDPCCPDASAAGQPVSFSAGELQTNTAGTVANVPNSAVDNTSPTPTAAQNDIAAGTGGAIPVTNYLTTVNTDADDDAFTLADGTAVGQQKKVRLVTDGGGNAVITPANLAAGTTITLDDAGDFVVLQWGGTEWFVIENSGGTIA